MYLVNSVNDHRIGLSDPFMYTSNIHIYISIGGFYLSVPRSRINRKTQGHDFWHEFSGDSKK